MKEITGCFLCIMRVFFFNLNEIKIVQKENISSLLLCKMYEINFYHQLWASVCSTKRRQFIWTWKSIPNNRYCPGNWANYKTFTFIFLGFCLNCKSTFNIKKIMNRSSHRKFSAKKCVHRIFSKFKEKHMCQGLFFNKVAGLTLFKKRLWHRCFPVNFEKFLRTPCLKNTSGRLLLYKWFLKWL